MKHQHQPIKHYKHDPGTPLITDNGRVATTSTPRLEHSSRLSLGTSHLIRRQVVQLSVTDNNHRTMKASIGAKFQNDPQGALFRGGLYENGSHLGEYKCIRIF